MAEEGSILRAQHRRLLLAVDNVFLTVSLAKFCTKNCGLFSNIERTDLDSKENDCLNTCSENVERTYEKFSEKMKEHLFVNNAFAKEEE